MKKKSPRWVEKLLKVVNPQYRQSVWPFAIVTGFNFAITALDLYAGNFFGAAIQAGVLVATFVFFPVYRIAGIAVFRRLWATLFRYQQIKIMIWDANDSLDNQKTRDAILCKRYPQMFHVETGQWGRITEPPTASWSNIPSSKWGWYGTAWFRNDAALVEFRLMTEEDKVILVD